jgi:glycosyltransferase involved in cell wall biosynthesis
VAASADSASRLRLAFYSDAVVLGGAERALAHLLGGLGPHVEATVLGTDRSVIAFLADARAGTATCLVPPVRNKRDVAPLLAHLRALRRIRPHILHANLRTPWTCQYALVSAILTPGVKAIATEHLPLPSDDQLQRRLKRALSRRLAAHIAVGERAARQVEEYAELRAGSLRVIHNGVPDLPPTRGAPLASGPLVGSLGRLDEQKGYDVLVRALAALPGVTAVLVGDGPERSRLERLAGDVGVGDRLVVTGWKEDARAYLSSFDVFVLPSRYEAFPLSILEAMLAELPVVASDVGGVSEAVVDGQTGLLVPVEDPEALAGAIRAALEPATRERLGRRGRERALARFSVSAMVDAYEALYDEVRGGAAPRRSPERASPR